MQQVPIQFEFLVVKKRDRTTPLGHTRVRVRVRVTKLTTGPAANVNNATWTPVHVQLTTKFN